MRRFFRTEAYPILSALLTAAIFLAGLTFLGITGFGNYTILWGDLVHQYIPFIKLFLSSITGKTDYWYSFSLYLGSGTALTYTYYCLSPFNLLYLIDYLPETVITVIVITLKLSLAAATFQCYEKKALKMNSPLSILFASCYALSGFTAGMYLNIMWLDTLYILPVLTYFNLMATGCIQNNTSENHTTPKLFVRLSLSFAYLFLTNFYMGFIVGIFELLIFVLSFFSRNGKFSIKGVICRSAFWIASVLLAAALCGATHIPAAYYLFSHVAQDNEDFRELTATIPDLINAFFIGTFQGINNSIPALYCGLPVLLLCPFFFLSKSISRRIKLLSAILIMYYVACMLILPLYKFMHAFDYPNYYGFRFSFCICFILISLAAYTLENNIGNISIKACTIYTLSLIVFYSIMIPLCRIRYAADQACNSYSMFVVNALFLSAYLLLFIFSRNSQHTSSLPAAKTILRITFSLLIITELITNIYVVGRNRGNTYEAALENWLTEGQPISDIQSKDASFYRISVENDLNANSPAWFNFAGLNTFSSSDDYNLRQALHHLGVAAPNREIYDIGYTPVTYALTGTKYHVINTMLPTDTEEPYTSSNATTKLATKASAHLPLLFLCSPKIADYSPQKNPFINQEALISCLYGRDCHFYAPIAQDRILTGKYNAELSQATDQMYFLRKTTLSSDAYYTFAVPHDDSSIFYICFCQEQSKEKSPATRIICNTTGSGTPVQPAMGSIVEGYTLGAESNICIANAAPQQIYDGISIYTDNPLIDSDTFISIMFYEYPRENNLKEICDDLTSTAPTITSFRSSDIKAMVHVTKDRPILFTTIPYDEGWSIYCDGKEIETIATVENAFLGARLPEGDHEIELKYTARFAKEGLIISIAAAVILIVIIIISLFLSRNQRRKNDLKG